MKIAGLPPAEYAAQWGCDSSYDRFPNEIGDGAQFYNYNVALNWGKPERLRFYERFVPAIERTIKGVKLSPEKFDEGSLAELEQLLTHVKAELALLRPKFSDEQIAAFKAELDKLDGEPEDVLAELQEQEQTDQVKTAIEILCQLNPELRKESVK